MGRAEYSLFKRQGKKDDVWYVRFWPEADQKYMKTDNPFITDYVGEFWRDVCDSPSLILNCAVVD